ncbi:hypothetical protein BDFG_04306 [Blastomyces dermatitidis ATCC 26199]|nr:hypothetical protein BDFG_04306 [Blastomyces dermatitidis ATCC 26199]
MTWQLGAKDGMHTTNNIIYHFISSATSVPLCMRLVTVCSGHQVHVQLRMAFTPVSHRLVLSPSLSSTIEQHILQNKKIKNYFRFLLCSWPCTCRCPMSAERDSHLPHILFFLIITGDRSVPTPL